jgi:tetratricopeptide (TPR) repeat protein
VPEPLLLQYYRKLPRPSPTDDAELWQAGIQEALKDFRQAVVNNYTEGTLQRLVKSPQAEFRQAAILALGLIGTMASNAAASGALKDSDWLVQRFAADAIWEIWLRGATVDHAFQLREALVLNDPQASLRALTDLIADAPAFAEAYNQRAIVLFHRGEFARCVSDCQTTLRLNPYHFGAAAGLGQAFLRMRKPRAALRAFRQALDLNPTLDEMRDAVEQLTEALGEEA